MVYTIEAPLRLHLSATFNLFDSVREIPAHFDFDGLRTLPYPGKALLCPPDYFDIIDVKNDFMRGQEGKVDRSKARREWEALRVAFNEAGVETEALEPTPGLEDMVFTANQTLVAVDAHGMKTCILADMRFPSRQLEVPAFDYWFSAHGYRVEKLGVPGPFEGAGDALWHPTKELLWGGVGPRTAAHVYDWIGRRFNTPVIRLRLASPRFYHLDTCFCPIDERTVLYYPEAFDRDGRELIERFFERRIEATAEEAAGMACNAAAFFGKVVVIQKGLERIGRLLQDWKISVIEVETDEFMKSGGSVFCMKMAYY